MKSHNSICQVTLSHPKACCALWPCVTKVPIARCMASSCNKCYSFCSEGILFWFKLIVEMSLVQVTPGKLVEPLYDNMPSHWLVDRVLSNGKYPLYSPYKKVWKMVKRRSARWHLKAPLVNIPVACSAVYFTGWPWASTLASCSGLLSPVWWFFTLRLLVRLHAAWQGGGGGLRLGTVCNLAYVSVRCSGFLQGEDECGNISVIWYGMCDPVAPWIRHPLFCTPVRYSQWWYTIRGYRIPVAFGISLYYVSSTTWILYISYPLDDKVYCRTIKSDRLRERSSILVDREGALSMVTFKLATVFVACGKAYTDSLFCRYRAMLLSLFSSSWRLFIPCKEWWQHYSPSLFDCKPMEGLSHWRKSAWTANRHYWL